MGDVFLCRSRDSADFTNKLYKALKIAGVDAFRDYYDVATSNVVFHHRSPLMQDVKIFMPIFSEAFASESLTLEYLATMSTYCYYGNKVVLPIFYGVKPHQVQNQTGSYAQDLLKHSSKYGHDVVQSWTNALAMLGARKGLFVKKDAADG